MKQLSMTLNVRRPVDEEERLPRDVEEHAAELMVTLLVEVVLMERRERNDHATNKQ